MLSQANSVLQPTTPLLQQGSDSQRNEHAIVSIPTTLEETPVTFYHSRPCCDINPFIAGFITYMSIGILLAPIGIPIMLQSAKYLAQGNIVEANRLDRKFQILVVGDLIWSIFVSMTPWFFCIKKCVRKATIRELSGELCSHDIGIRSEAIKNLLQRIARSFYDRWILWELRKEIFPAIVARLADESLEMRILAARLVRILCTDRTTHKDLMSAGVILKLLRLYKDSSFTLKKYADNALGDIVDGLGNSCDEEMKKLFNNTFTILLCDDNEGVKWSVERFRDRLLRTGLI